MRITSAEGKTHNLSKMAIKNLQRAKYAHVAADVFQEFAPHVPVCDRLGIWTEADFFTQEELELT